MQLLVVTAVQIVYTLILYKHLLEQNLKYILYQLFVI